jgi:hypothetical protein
MAAPTFTLTFAPGASTNSTTTLGPPNVASPGTNLQQPTYQIDDANATIGKQMFDMSQNRQVNVRGSDGVIRKCEIDSYRSDPSRGLIYFLQVP